MSLVTRRELLLGSSAAAVAFSAGGLAASKAVAGTHSLTLSHLDYGIVPDTVTRDMMSFSPDGPPPVLRFKQGEAVAIDVTNNIDEASVVHWHGLRIPNGMDGVPYLTQYPIEAGERFRYAFTPPDAGTFWYHPHCNTLEQMARGRAVVERTRRGVAGARGRWIAFGAPRG